MAGTPQGEALATHRFTVQLGAYMVETLMEVNGLSFELDSIDHYEVTKTGTLLVRKLAGARKGGEVTLTRGINVSQEFTNWLKAAMVDGNVGEARQNCTITVTDTQGKVVRTIELQRAWVKKWEGPNLKAGSSEAAQEKVTVVFEDVVLS